MKWLERIFKMWVADPIVERIIWYMGFEKDKGITAVQPGYLQTALDEVREAAVEWSNNHALEGAHEVGDMLYELQLAVSGLVPLERQAFTLQQVQIENARLKAMLLINAKCHHRALLHLVRVLPDEDSYRSLYAHGAERLDAQIKALE